MEKYRLTDETIDFCDATLYRIEALRDFGPIKAGDKGGLPHRRIRRKRFYNN